MICASVRVRSWQILSAVAVPILKERPSRLYDVALLQFENASAPRRLFVATLCHIDALLIFPQRVHSLFRFARSLFLWRRIFALSDFLLLALALSLCASFFSFAQRFESVHYLQSSAPMLRMDRFSLVGAEVDSDSAHSAHFIVIGVRVVMKSDRPRRFALFAFRVRLRLRLLRVRVRFGIHRFAAQTLCFGRREGVL